MIMVYPVLDLILRSQEEVCILEAAQNNIYKCYTVLIIYATVRKQETRYTFHSEIIIIEFMTRKFRKEKEVMFE